MRTAAREEGHRVSIRMGPGYVYRDGDADVCWPLTEQKTLFEVFDGIDLPVHLMESCAMTPKMSRSGIYGLSPVM
jgi:cobalamin-dependent methionine synthase I